MKPCSQNKLRQTNRWDELSEEEVHKNSGVSRLIPKPMTLARVWMPPMRGHENAQDAIAQKRCDSGPPGYLHANRWGPPDKRGQKRLDGHREDVCEGYNQEFVVQGTRECTRIRKRYVPKHRSRLDAAHQSRNRSRFRRFDRHVWRSVIVRIRDKQSPVDKRSENKNVRFSSSNPTRVGHLNWLDRIVGWSKMFWSGENNVWSEELVRDRREWSSERRFF